MPSGFTPVVPLLAVAGLAALPYDLAVNDGGGLDFAWRPSQTREDALADPRTHWPTRGRTGRPGGPGDGQARPFARRRRVDHRQLRQAPSRTPCSARCSQHQHHSRTHPPEPAGAGGRETSFGTSRQPHQMTLSSLSARHGDGFPSHTSPWHASTARLHFGSTPPSRSRRLPDTSPERERHRRPRHLEPRGRHPHILGARAADNGRLGLARHGRGNARMARPARRPADPERRLMDAFTAIRGTCPGFDDKFPTR